LQVEEARAIRGRLPKDTLGRLCLPKRGTQLSDRCAGLRSAHDALNTAIQAGEGELEAASSGVRKAERAVSARARVLGADDHAVVASRSNQDDCVVCGRRRGLLVL